MDKFPVGGPRYPVFAFLMKHGWVMSKWSDKHWTRHDGLDLLVYGTGSQARVSREKEVTYDGPLDGVSSM